MKIGKCGFGKGYINQTIKFKSSLDFEMESFYWVFFFFAYKLFLKESFDS